MTTTGPRFGITYDYVAGESGWTATMNADLRSIDALVSALLQSVTVSTVPATPAIGDCYFVPTGSGGAWTGRAGMVASYGAAGWNFFSCPAGFRARVVDTSSFQYYTGSAWLAELAASSVVTFDTDGTIKWSQMKAELQSLPIAYVLPGKPGAGQTYNVVLAVPATLAANFAGSLVYAGTLATASAVFTVNKISAGVTTALGTLTITTASHTSATLSVQAAASFGAGDVLQLVAPAVQDATLSDVGITLLCAKV